MSGAKPAFQPVNQVRLTNVAVVRMKQKGLRFEIACYKNKVVDWRNKVEKDIDQVLQSHTVFSNVSKGTIAKKKDLITAFETEDEEEILLMILDKGELQVAQKEREADLEAKSREIITIICDKCVDRDTRRPFPFRIIETALKDVHFSVKSNKSSKQQALEAIKLLEHVIPIQRAQMRVRLELGKAHGKAVKAMLADKGAVIENEEYGVNYEAVACIDPGAFRAIDELVQQLSKGKGQIEVMDMKVDQLDDADEKSLDDD